MSTDAGPLRILIFGPPRAGKTALLAALAQAQQMQPHLLGRLDDPTGHLARQRQIFYDELPGGEDGRTAEYPVRIETEDGPREAVFIDCEPDAAGNLAPGAKLDAALLDADAVLVAADASDRPERVSRVLSSLDDFLHRYERVRGDRADVPGLPVFLVLTKADLLADDRDGAADWMNRIESQKRLTHQQLHDFLDDPEDVRPEEFGRLAVELWATAARRPALGGSPARPREPFNVAELFRRSVNAAADYRRRRAAARKRMRWTVGGTAALAGTLGLLAVALVLGVGRREPSELERELENFRAMQPRALSERLHHDADELKARAEYLEEIVEVPAYRRLPAALKETITRLPSWGVRLPPPEVRGAVETAEFRELPEALKEYARASLDELREYTPYLERVLARQYATLARNDEQLNRREQELLADLAPPREGWEDTGAGRLRQQRLDDLRVLRQQADVAETWYRTQGERGIRLYTFGDPGTRTMPLDWRTWRDEVEKYLDALDRPPPAVDNLPPGSLVTPTAVLEMSRVAAARGEVRVMSERLGTVRSIGYALGLIDPNPLQPALLVVPRPFPAEEARARWDRLAGGPSLAATLAGLTLGDAGGPRAAAALPALLPYPDWDRAFRLERVPDVAQPEVGAAADANYRYLLAPTRALIRGRVDAARGGREDTHEHWKAVAAWLDGDPAPVHPYRRLGSVLDRLRTPFAADPVALLVEFLRRNTFSFQPRGVELVVPYSWGVTPGAGAALTIRSGQQTVALKPEPGRTDADPQARVTTYYFADPETSLTWKPGESFTVTLQLEKGRLFTWQEARTRAYAVEAAALPPRLHARDQAPENGNRADGVILRFSGESPPAVPDLLPDLR